MQSMASGGSLHLQVNVEYNEETQDEIQAGEYTPNDLSDDTMNGNDTRVISVIWPESPPDSHIHIFVRVPRGISSERVSFLLILGPFSNVLFLFSYDCIHV